MLDTEQLREQIQAVSGVNVVQELNVHFNPDWSPKFIHVVILTDGLDNDECERIHDVIEDLVCCESELSPSRMTVTVI